MEVSSHALCAGPGVRHPLRRGHLHQPDPGPPGLPQDHGGLLRRQGHPVPATATWASATPTIPGRSGCCKTPPAGGISYAEHAAADLRAENIALAADHIAFDAVTKIAGDAQVKVGIPGGFMVYNTLDVLGAALALGVPLEKSARALAAVPHVKGRVEVVPTPGKDYTVLIDYCPQPRRSGERSHAP